MERITAVDHFFLWRRGERSAAQTWAARCGTGRTSRPTRSRGGKLRCAQMLRLV